MKKSLAFAMISCIASAVAEDSNQEMLNTLVNHLHTSSELVKDAACLGVSTSVLEDAYEKHLFRCADIPAARSAADIEAFMVALEHCSTPAVLEELNISRREAAACLDIGGVGGGRTARTGNAGEKYNGSDDEIEALMARLEADEFPQGGASPMQLELVQQTKIQSEEREIRLAMGGVASAAKATQNLITLPIYKNSEIIVHMADFGPTQRAPFGKSNDGGEKEVEMIPAATFASPDSPEEVLAFYRRKLPDFKFKQLAADEYILMESMPENFDLLRHMQEYTSTPHILIRKAVADAVGVFPATARSMIEIAYRK